MMLKLVSRSDFFCVKSVSVSVVKIYEFGSLMMIVRKR